MPKDHALGLLGAIPHFDAGLFANELIARVFIGVLKASPSVDVADQDVTEVGVVGLDVG
jgi:hypothetical protein